MGSPDELGTTFPTWTSRCSFIRAARASTQEDDRDPRRTRPAPLGFEPSTLRAPPPTNSNAGRARMPTGSGGTWRRGPVRHDLGGVQARLRHVRVRRAGKAGRRGCARCRSQRSRAGWSRRSVQPLAARIDPRGEELWLENCGVASRGGAAGGAVQIAVRQGSAAAVNGKRLTAFTICSRTEERRSRVTC